MWERVVGSLVEADPQIMPERVEFVGNWEVDEDVKTWVELN